MAIQRGKLKIFFGYAAGTGLTYSMLNEAHKQMINGVDVLVGYIEPHTRAETIQLLKGLPILLPKLCNYKNINIKEFDLDAALKKRPQLIIVDELAHANVEGVRNKKRYQDIEELLNAGIDVYTTINVHHIESFNKFAKGLLPFYMGETIPDYVFDNADNVTLIDVERNFTKENLTKLREIAIIKMSERTNHNNQIEKLSINKNKLISDNILKTSKDFKGINLGHNFYFSWIDTFKTISILALITLLSLGLHAFDIGNQNIMLMYILSVLIISRVTHGYAYGVIASVISVLTFNFFFTKPYFTFIAIQVGYPITFVIMLIVALITSALTVRIKTQASFAVERERRTEVLYEINKKLLVTRGLENIVALTTGYITKLFERSVIFYIQDPENDSTQVFKQSSDLDSSFMLTKDERSVAHWVFVNQKSAGSGTNIHMGAGAFYLPLVSQGKVLGVLGTSCINGNMLNQNNKYFLKMIVSQVAMALERQHLSDEQRRIFIESEKEKMRSNLLRAISHDLRTPLTGILGASSAILENSNTMDVKIHDKLILGIKEDSQWLIRMVENLLAVTRINQGNMNVAKTPEAVEEIVSEAISRIKKIYDGYKINVKVPNDLLLVPMDGILIEQVIINLVENAIKHTGENTVVDITVKKEENTVIFEISDNGEGIPNQDLPFLFESYSTNDNKSPDSSFGIGIGLSICMSIIMAHNGKMDAFNKKDGGAVFRFTLPLEEEM